MISLIGGYISPHAFSRRKLDLSLCVFCHTLVYEHCTKIDKNGDSAAKKSKEASGKKNEGDSSGKPSLNFTETFKLHIITLSGP